jgi:Uma2 family endonuclease
VVEIVSRDNPERETQEKPRDYAVAGISEYWSVNPLDDTITVLVLEDETYVTFGVFPRGERARSNLLNGFNVSVDEVFDAK